MYFVNLYKKGQKLNDCLYNSLFQQASFRKKVMSNRAIAEHLPQSMGGVVMGFGCG